MMRTSFLSIGITLALFVIAGVFLWQKAPWAPATAGSKVADVPPAQVIPFGDSGRKQVVLIERAAQRLGIATAPIETGQVSGHTIIPYAALIYDVNGDTWVYTNPEALVYVRQSITVLSIDQDLVLLSSGPPADTLVVTTGAAELFGVEFGVGK